MQTHISENNNKIIAFCEIYARHCITRNPKKVPLLVALLHVLEMGVLTKKPKTFDVQLNDPNKLVYSGGDKVAGRVIVEVSEVMRISAVRLFGIGCAKVDYTKGKQRCREEIDYLKYEEVLHLDHQPTGEKQPLVFLAQMCL